MRADVLIVGQGLAGSLLAWELERAGVPCAIVDDGHRHSATLAAAGLLTPITGRRLVKSWRYDVLAPIARETYRAIQAELGVPLWRDLRVRRLFADEGERALAEQRRTEPEYSPYVESTDESGWWMRGAARVDLRVLLTGLRHRWRERGRLREGRAGLQTELDRFAVVVDCRGVAGTQAPAFRFVPWEFSKGEVLELRVDGLEPDVVVNRRWWVVATEPGCAMAGATHEPGVIDASPTEAARTRIEGAVRALLGPERPITVTGQRAGVRVNLPDKRPVAGRHPELRGLGVANALGAKGALWAPLLARLWAGHLTTGAPFDPEVDVNRFPSRGT